jgi:hypothetical protein
MADMADMAGNFEIGSIYPLPKVQRFDLRVRHTVFSS